MIGPPSLVRLDRASATRIWWCVEPTDTLDLYHHLHDDDGQQAMQALAATGTDAAVPVPRRAGEF